MAISQYFEIVKSHSINPFSHGVLDQGGWGPQDPQHILAFWDFLKRSWQLADLQCFSLTGEKMENLDFFFSFKPSNLNVLSSSFLQTYLFRKGSCTKNVGLKVLLRC